MFGRKRPPMGEVPPGATDYQEKTVFSTEPSAPAPQTQQMYSAPQPQQMYSAPQPQQSFGGYTTTPNGGAVTEMRPLYQEPQEKPRVFASRKSPDIFIYEYSDRLEYYLRTATSMYKFHTVMRNGH